MACPMRWEMNRLSIQVSLAISVAHVDGNRTIPCRGFEPRRTQRVAETSTAVFLSAYLSARRGSRAPGVRVRVDVVNRRSRTTA